MFLEFKGEWTVCISYSPPQKCSFSDNLTGSNFNSGVNNFFGLRKKQNNLFLLQLSEYWNKRVSLRSCLRVLKVQIIIILMFTQQGLRQPVFLNLFFIFFHSWWKKQQQQLYDSGLVKILTLFFLDYKILILFFIAQTLL